MTHKELERHRLNIEKLIDRYFTECGINPRTVLVMVDGDEAVMTANMSMENVRRVVDSFGKSIAEHPAHEPPPSLQ